MVLQQAPAKAVVWGFCTGAGCATAGLVVRVGPSTGGSDFTVPVTTDGVNTTAWTWRAVLPPVKAGRAGAMAYTIAVGAPGSTASASIDDVLFGELWVCSG